MQIPSENHIFSREFLLYMSLPVGQLTSSIPYATSKTLPQNIHHESLLPWTRVSQTVLRGKVASAPRKLLNAKFYFLRAIICDF
jgi:hypothetical protein